ncbi:MAG: hypothetical protein ABIN18_08735 [Pseudomonadota bacterium]
MFKIRLRSIARRIEMDRIVSYAILARVWGVAAGPITALLIVAKFSPTIQGFYYTFMSVLALQVFAELGIGFAISQFAIHEWAHLRIDENRKISGDPDSLSRLASLAQIAVKWYSIAAIVLIVGLSVGGYIFFSKSPSQNVNWKLPWFSLCILSGFSLFSSAIWYFLEGCNQVKNVYYYRLFQGLLGSLAIWTAILFGAELWAVSIMTLIGLIYVGIFLRIHYWDFFKSLLLKKKEGSRLSWLKDIFPFQWRIALSWISGYFAFSLFTPMLFYYHGPVIAGQMGMTWSIASALSAIGGAWLGPRIPQFGIFVAEKRYVEMDKLFWRLIIIITGITALGGVAIYLLVFALNYYDYSLAHRLLPPFPTALFLLGAIIHAASNPMLYYLRAHKKEPLLFVSVLLGCLIGLSTWVLGKHYSALGIAVGYLTIYVMIFPLIVAVWLRCKKAWHIV